MRETVPTVDLPWLAPESAAANSVLIVEDHAVVAFGLIECLRRQRPELRVEVATDSRQALRQLDHADWRFILLDLHVPGAQDVSLAHAVQARGLAHRCCVISATAVPAHVEELRRLGLAGFIDKRMALPDFSRALDQVMRGHRVFPRAPAGEALREAPLTCRQVGILRHIQRGLSSKQIAAELGLAEGTVRNHTILLMRALGVNNRTHAVTRGLELGILAQ